MLKELKRQEKELVEKTKRELVPSAKLIQDEEEREFMESVESILIV